MRKSLDREPGSWHNEILELCGLRRETTSVEMGRIAMQYISTRDSGAYYSASQAIAQGLGSLKGVAGRLERVAEYNGGSIFVDFAHTPDGLKKSLEGLGKLCKGKLYCLFGCGGNRDRTKRPLMGQVAAENADFLIVTSDNPRFEDAYDIIADIEPGIQKVGAPYVTISDRQMATEYAVNLLGKGDILLVAGKGGETYQEIMGIKHSYNDNTVIKRIVGK